MAVLESGQRGPLWTRCNSSGWHRALWQMVRFSRIKESKIVWLIVWWHLPFILEERYQEIIESVSIILGWEGGFSSWVWQTIQLVDFYLSSRDWFPNKVLGCGGLPKRLSWMRYGPASQSAAKPVCGQVFAGSRQPSPSEHPSAHPVGFLHLLFPVNLEVRTFLQEMLFSTGKYFVFIFYFNFKMNLWFVNSWGFLRLF